MKLLTPQSASPKLKKSTDHRYLSAILYLSGALDSRLCPASTAGCRASCLVPYSGRGVFSSIRSARQAKTDFYFNNRHGFLFQLDKEINSLKAKAKRLGKKPAVRLNGGSDLDWTDVFAKHPDVIFWDYTKRPDLALNASKLPNVHMTFSWTKEASPRVIAHLMEQKINVAMVFNQWSRKHEPLPKHVGNVRVIDGDVSDFRFLDPKEGLIVGLRLKSSKKPKLTNAIMAF